MPRVIISEAPGTTWTNDTERVYYQFIAALNNTCGVCLQYHLKVSNGAWPVPIHYGCRCIQRQIKPGQTAGKPFCDYRELLDKMPQEEKRAAIGASNYKLLKSGLATWEDIVTPSRVRDFREVVAKKRLTVKQMSDHGVKPAESSRAYSAVHTEEHEHIERQRKELLQKLTGAGLSQQNIVNELSKGLAARVTIAPGPTGPYSEGPAWTGGKLPVPARATAAELAELIAGWKPAVIPKAQVDALRKDVQQNTAGLKDVLDGDRSVGVEGRSGKDAEAARKAGLYVTEVNGTVIYARDEAAARPLVEYLKAGGRYGTTKFSRLLGYSETEIETYKKFLRASGKSDLITD